MRIIFPTRPEIKYPWENIFQTFNVNTTCWGTQSLTHMGPKLWRSIPVELKKLPYVEFKKAIRAWKPMCSCNICQQYIQGLGYI